MNYKDTYIAAFEFNKSGMIFIFCAGVPKTLAGRRPQRKWELRKDQTLFFCQGGKSNPASQDSVWVGWRLSNMEHQVQDPFLSLIRPLGLAFSLSHTIVSQSQSKYVCKQSWSLHKICQSRSMDLSNLIRPPPIHPHSTLSSSGQRYQMQLQSSTTSP